MIEEFLNKYPSDVRIFIAERQVQTLADEYDLNHSKRQHKANNEKMFLGLDSVSQKTEVVRRQPRNQYGNSHKDCHFCKTPCHLMADC